MFLKDPETVIDYQVDWTAALAAGSGLQTSEWAVVPGEAGGVAVVWSAVDGAMATARLAGGVPGHVYLVGNRVAMTDGTIDERSLTVRVEDR